jgi:hypothetical protein
MAGKCIDRRDLTTQNALALSAGPAINFDGEYTVAQIDIAAQELAQNILENAENNPIQIAVNRYGNTFYEANNYINGQFRVLIADRLKDYPEAERRLSRGSISTLELADFIENYSYTPQGIINQTDYTMLLRQIDNYYRDSFTTSIAGGFCNTLQNVFAQIDAFYDLIGKVAGIINDALETIQKIVEFDGFQVLFDQLKQEIIDAIRDIYEKIILAVIQEISDFFKAFDILEILGDFADDLKSAGMAGVKGIMTAKEQMCILLSEDSEKSLLDKVNGVIDYTISLFENPGLEQIQYMAFRFCALISNIEASFKDLKKPFNNYGAGFQRITKRMQAISNINTSTAIRAGAVRYSPQRKQEGINRLKARWTSPGANEKFTPTGEKPLIIPAITVKEYKNLPNCNKVFKGEDSRIKLEGDWVKDLGIAGYTRIDLDVKVYLMRVQAELGTTFTITRGWYSKAYNDEIGGDPENSHLSGLVIDIKNDGFDVDQFTESALKNGFKYIIIKDDYIHLDIREIPR